MTPTQLTAAVRCYISMRNSVTQADKTPDAGINVLLSQTRNWTAAQVWGQLWPLFFYSGMKERFATPRVRAAVTGGWFDDFAVLAAAIHDPAHPWHVREMKTTKMITTGKRQGKFHAFLSYTAVGQDVRSFCNRDGIYSRMPYKTGAKVVYRISELAEFFSELNTSASAVGVSVIDQLAGGDATAPNALGIAFNRLRPVTGPITALHGLSDLGFLCHKPDIWMCRIASWCGWTPGYSPDDLLNDRRDGWRVLREACLAIAQEAQRQGGISDPNPLRAFDWYVANYGMQFKPTACPCNV